MLGEVPRSWDGSRYSYCSFMVGCVATSQSPLMGSGGYRLDPQWFLVDLSKIIGRVLSKFGSLEKCEDTERPETHTLSEELASGAPS